MILHSPFLVRHLLYPSHHVLFGLPSIPVAFPSVHSSIQSFCENRCTQRWAQFDDEDVQKVMRNIKKIAEKRKGEVTSANASYLYSQNHD